MWWTWMLASAATAGSPGAMPTQPVEQPWLSRPAVSFIDGDTVHLYGVLHDDMFEPLREQLARAPVPPRQLRIASAGGDGLVGLAVGELVRQYDLEVVVVPPGCGSACASYVFTGAARKVISLGAVVVWHNSCPNAALEDPETVKEYLRENLGNGFELRYVIDDATVEDPDRLRALLEQEIDGWAMQFAAYARQWRTAHDGFFAGSVIDDRGVCLEDHLDLPEVPPGSFSYSYTLPVADMERLGICNVEAPADYVEQATQIFARRGRAVDFGVISLADHPRFVPLHAPGYCATITDNATPRKPAAVAEAEP